MAYMKLVKRILVGVGGAATLYFLIATAVLTYRTNVATKEIYAQFEIVAECIDQFKARTGRLPSTGEYSDCDRKAEAVPTKYVAKVGQELLRFQYLNNNFPSDILEKHGKPPEQAFLLQYWRGELFESYISWNREKTRD
jgi:hypothetical protein